MIVTTTDAKLPNVQIILSGKIKLFLDVVSLPSVIDFGDVTHSGKETVRLISTNRDSRLCQIKNVEYDHAIIELNKIKRKKSDKDENEFDRYDLVLKKDNLKNGSGSSEIIFLCSLDGKDYQVSTKIFYTKLSN